jgi:flavin-dependent dehydrogenase
VSATPDVCVIGAGPAGALLAAQLARAGAAVTLIGAAGGPARLESMTLHGARLLAELGHGAALAGAAAGRAERIALDWREAPETREPGADGPLLVMRPRLERLLAEAAAAAGARCAPQARARRVDPDGTVTLTGGATLRARIVVDAAGRRAGFRPSPRALAPMNAAIGFRGRAPAGAEGMALRAHRDGWLWTVALPGGRLHGVWVGEARALAGLGAEGRARLVAARSDADAIAPAFVAEAGLCAAATAADGRVLRIGDAALARDPVSGHGLGWALGSAARAAAAALTLLDPAGAHDAARAFLTLDHARAVAAARAATARAYADQRRFADAPFWRARARGAEARPDPAQAPPAALRLRADATLCRAPALEGARIVWRPALNLPGAGLAAAYVAGCPADIVHRALAAPDAAQTSTAPEAAQALTARLGDRAAAVIAALWRDGALMRADEN